MRCGTWARLHPRPGRLRRLPSPGRRVRRITPLRAAARLHRRECQPGEVRPPERLGPAPALLRREDPLRVRLPLELGEERRPGLRGRLVRIAVTVLRIGGQPRPEAPFSGTYGLVPCHGHLAICVEQQSPRARHCGYL